jgi:hypothetical protein
LTRNATPDELRALQPLLSLAIVERRTLTRNAAWIASAQRQGVTVWTYDVPAPSKASSPGSTYRLLPWEAWARGLQGCGFWAYGDTGLRSADAWNDFDGRRWDFAVVYGETGSPRGLLGEGLAPSKRWQAFRIGIQDTALLTDALQRRPDLRAAILHALSGDSSFDPDALRRRILSRRR